MKITTIPIHYLFVLATLLLTTTCSKPERDNPWDEKSTLKPEDWAPSDLQINSLSMGERKLTWQYRDKHIQGFRIDRKPSGAQWQEGYAILSKEARSWNDTAIMPGENITYEYRLMAVAGDFKSESITATTEAPFAPPSDFSALKTDLRTFKLSWKDNSTGEDGFKIDRKVGDNPWEANYATVLPNTITWTDTNIFHYRAGIEVQYQVYGFYKTALSEKISTTGSTELPVPTNLTATFVSASKIEIAWNYSIPWIGGFVIDRKIGNDNWVDGYKQVTGLVNSCSDENFTLNTPIYYRVKAFINFFNSEFVSGFTECNVGVSTVTTTSVSAIAQATATSGGNVISDGGVTITARGVCWSTSSNPTLADPHTFDGYGTGSFTSSLTGLTPNTTYYVRAYATNSTGTAYGNKKSFTTLLPCGNNYTLTINHVTGAVAPVNKTVTYGTVTNIPGETDKCWITSNLGATNQATSLSDATEASSGWYWQFNRKQGFKYDGHLTPATAWLTSITDHSNWQLANDPCTLELGNGWRLPTKTEWNNVNASGNWTNWNGPWNSGLKLHPAGYLEPVVRYRGFIGYYWSSTQADSYNGCGLEFSSMGITMNDTYKEFGFSARCLRD